jgi:hypothetical protein
MGNKPSTDTSNISTNCNVFVAAKKLTDVDYKPLVNIIEQNQNPSKIKEYSVETTITRVDEYLNTSFKISSNPTFNNSNKSWEDKNYLYLKRDHPNFIDLYNKLKENETYKFTYIYNNNVATINDISSPDENTISGVIKGFITVGTEYVGLKNYREIIFENSNNGKRILSHVDNIKNITVNSSYTIIYVKAFAKNFYRVISFTKGNDT